MTIIHLATHRIARARGAAWCAQIAAQRAALDPVRTRRIVDAAKRAVMEGHTSAAAALADAHRAIRHNRTPNGAA